MNNPNAYPNAYPIEQELILRYKERLKTVFSNPNPLIKPLWERTEILSKIKELEKIKN